MQQAPGPSSFQAAHQFLQDPLGMFTQAQQRWGDVVRFAAFGYEMYQITDPHLAQMALTHPQLEMSIMMEHPFTGHGLANNSGESWKNQRRIMQPSFHRKVISHFASHMVESTELMLATWQNGTVIDILPPLLRLHHQILGKASLDIDFYQHPEMLDALTIIRSYLSQRFQALLTIPESIPTPQNRAFKRAVKVWDSAIKEIMAHDRGDKSFLAMFRAARDPRNNYQMTDEQLRDEINTIFFNGYEDPAVTLTWALYLLCQNPEQLACLNEEIQKQLGDKAPSTEDLDKLPYLDHVIHETLRLYPPTWSIMRDAQTNIVLGDYAIPKGASVQVTVFLLHRHEKYWSNAQRFMPERFAESYPVEAYMPFGAGSRQCIARSYATMQIKLVLIMLLQRFRFELMPQNIRLDGQASLRPKNGLKLQLRSKTD